MPSGRGPPGEILTLENIEAIVEVAVRAACMHESAVSLTDLARLMPEDTNTTDLVTAFESLPTLRENYLLKEGYVLSRSEAHKELFSESERRRHSIANITLARVLSSRLGGRDALVFAVSGSTSYQSASVHDDIDLFCVTPRGKMWIFLAKVLVRIRALQLVRKSSRSINVSCVMDEEYARTMFSADQGPLFARDALMAEVVHGREAYDGLLESASWMRLYFPKLYILRKSLGRAKLRAQRSTPVGHGIANRFLYFAFGSYIRVKARLHNRLLVKEGKRSSLFIPRIGLDHLFYESERYLTLKAIYSSMRHDETDVSSQPAWEEGRPRSSESDRTLT